MKQLLGTYLSALAGLLILMLLFTSCGDSTIKLENPDEPITGETYSYVVIQMEFISEMRLLCEQSLATQSFVTEELRNKEIADCTFDKLSILDLEALNNFNNEICSNPVTQEEIDICNALN